MNAEIKDKLEKVIKSRIKVPEIKSFVTSDYILIVEKSKSGISNEKKSLLSSFDFYRDIDEIKPIKYFQIGITGKNNLYRVLSFNIEGILIHYPELINFWDLIKK